MGAVVPREPDLVHAVVERHDAVLRHHLAYIAHDPLRRWWKPLLVGAVTNVCKDFGAQADECGIWLQLALQTIRQERQISTDVAHHLGVRKEHLLDGSRRKSDVNHL